MSTQPEATAGPTAQQRAAAWLAYASLALASVYLVVVTFRRWDVLLAGLATLAVMVVALWFAVSRRGTTRLVALGVAAAALVLFAVVMVASSSLRVLVVGVLLAALSTGSARFALRPPTVDPAQVPVDTPGAARRADHEPVERRGEGGAVRARAAAAASAASSPSCSCKGSDLLALAEDAVQRGADVIGMAGGDGSQALVASVASRHGIPMVVIPAGTRNHFALDLGLDRDGRRRARSTRTTTASSGRSTWPRSTAASSSTTRRWGCTRRSSSPTPTGTPRCARPPRRCPT